MGSSAKQQKDKPLRSEAIHRLIESALAVKGHTARCSGALADGKFIEEKGGSPGVRLKKPQRKRP